MRRTWRLSLVGLAVGTTIGLFVIPGIVNNKPRLKEAEYGPVLQRIKAIGELRTTRFAYKDVLNYTTHREPTGIAASFSPLAAMVEKTTENNALISYDAMVEAGVNLKAIQLVRKPEGLEIRLPVPKVYRPEVRTELHEHQRGLFWDDREIVLEAQAEASRRVRKASLEQGIVEKAKESARETVSGLFSEAGVRVSSVEFVAS